MRLPEVYLRTYRSSFHQWIYAKMVRRPERKLAPGTIVRVLNKDGSFTCIGIYNPLSTIAIRVLSIQDAPTGPVFFRERLRAAKRLREDILRLNAHSDSYRLIHSESDALPGLIIDKYGSHFLVKPYSSGYQGPVMDSIAEALRDVFPGAQVHVASDEKACTRDHVSYAAEEKKYPVRGGRPLITENDLSFQVDLAGGQKTGYFLDQKLNRKLAADVCGGEDVLDLYCYTGGFGIHCLKAGARSAVGVDLDPLALEIAKQNAHRNGVKMDFHCLDVFEHLKETVASGKKYGLVIADPAKLASVKAEVSRAVKTFSDLNELAIRAVKPGGLLFTFSCTGMISGKIFQSVVFSAAQNARANLRVLYNVGPSPDHPYSSAFPEGRYLHGLLMQVDPQ